MGILTHKPNIVKSYPEIDQAVLRQHLENDHRLWLLGRATDQAGRGWLTTQDLCQAGILSSDTIYRSLRNASGIFWERKGNRVRFCSLLKVANALGCELRSRPVLWPISELKTIARFRAGLVGSMLAYKPRQIAHATWRKLTGMPGTTERRYVAPYKVRKNITLSSRPAPRFGASVDVDLANQGFHRTKVNGQWRLATHRANTYATDMHYTTRFGMLKHQRSTTSSATRGVRRLYYDKPKAGARAIEGLQPGEGVHVRLGTTKDFWDCQCWHTWSNQPGPDQAWSIRRV